jgi:hypothetical protein
MSPGVLLRHARDRLESLRRLMDRPQNDGPAPLTADDYQELVSLVLEFPASYRKAVDSELRRVFTDRSRSIEQLQYLRSDLTELADRFTTLVRAVEEDPGLCALAKQEGRFRDYATQLAEAVATLQADKARLVQDWPVCSPEEMERVAADRQREAFVPVDQAFAEMKGISVDELRQRLEEHKAKRKQYGWE